MAFCDAQNFTCGFPRKHLIALRIRKSYSNQSRAHLATSTEWVSSQTNESCSCQLISPFTMDLKVYGSPYDYVIHVGLIVAMCISLITSFQPGTVSVCIAQEGNRFSSVCPQCPSMCAYHNWGYYKVYLCDRVWVSRISWPVFALKGNIYSGCVCLAGQTNWGPVCKLK